MRHLQIGLVARAFAVSFADSALAQGSLRVARTAVIDLPPDAEPTALNNRGAIVGTARTEGRFAPFLWTSHGGTRFFLGAVRGIATAINDRGVVAGVTCPDDTEFCFGFVWSAAAGVRELGLFHPMAINNRG